MPRDVICEPLVRRLNVSCGVPEEDIRTIRELPLAVREYQPESMVLRDGQRATECCLIAEGFCARSMANARFYLYTFRAKSPIL